MQAQTYAEAYGILKGIAERLRNAGPADVDSLAEDFRTARGAYTICRDRLEAIRQEIDQEIDRTGADKSEGEDPFA